MYLCSFTFLALQCDSATHLVNNLGADTQAEPCAFGIHALVFIQPSVVFEQHALVLLGNADSIVLHSDLQLNILHDLRAFIFIRNQRIADISQ